MSKSSSSPTSKVPFSILIVGSGVFGLSTALALCSHAAFKDAEITLVDRSAFPPADASSVDSSRIVRADYADRAYAELARQAQERWRGEWGAEGRYTECGLCLIGVGNGGTERRGKEATDNWERDYVNKSLKNVLALEEEFGHTSAKSNARGNGSGGTTKRRRGIEILPTVAEIKRIMHGGSSTSSTGYVNWNSGWADAEASMQHLHQRVRSLNRIHFVTGQVARLLFSNPSTDPSSSLIVIGALLTSGEFLSADLIILAAGAWTPTLLDLRGLCTATAQPLAYIPLSPSERATLSQLPSLLDLSTGYFTIPPNPRENLLKIARHTFGYVNPVRVPHPEPHPHSGEHEHILTSVPLTSHDDPAAHVPLAAQAGLRTALADMLPPALRSIASRPFAHTRLCWYTDTPTGDFLVDYHPRYGRSLFVATGGSGHAFKFLPVLGERVVDCLEGGKGERGGGVEDKWRWPGDWEDRRRRAVRECGGMVCTEDGSRAGERRVLLREELEKGGVKGEGLGWSRL